MSLSPRERKALSASLLRLGDGERACFDEVYRGLWPPLLTFCRALLGSGPDGEDAAQQALLKLFERASDFQPEGDALTWALTLAMWEVRTQRRRRQRSRLSPGEVPDRATGEPGPEALLMSGEAEAALCAAMGELNAADREVLRQWLEAEHDGGPTFRKRKQRALARLRSLWRRIYGEP